VINLPSGVDINNLIDDLKKISWEAADIINYYSRKINETRNKKEFIRSKSIKDPVTIADLKVNQLVIERINQKYPNINWDILSEENQKLTKVPVQRNSPWIWILDPLDGTKDFIQGTGNFAMHLALNYQNKPLLGLVLIPEKDELWMTNGDKVWCDSRTENSKKVNLTNNFKLEDMKLVMSKNHRNSLLQELIENIPFRTSMEMGSIGCKISSIIKGEADIYLSLSIPGQNAPKDWDFAAPEAILDASGGKITNLDNENLKYNSKDYKHSGVIIASNNKENHEAICKQIKKIILEKDILPFIV
tara:strand:+ start:51763 stop:52671 length:909 start_codon:yes stop_codon:yes gene_type:complete